MLYSLRNGKVIELTLEEFLFLSDDEITQLEGTDLGDHIENPFFNSSLGFTPPGTDYILTDFSELPITCIPTNEKLSECEFLPIE